MIINSNVYYCESCRSKIKDSKPYQYKTPFGPKIIYLCEPCYNNYKIVGLIYER